MVDTQGRGSYQHDGRIEQAAKRAKENGGTDNAIRTAAGQVFGYSNVTETIVSDIRQKMSQLF